jgi:hypothetical protein
MFVCVCVCIFWQRENAKLNGEKDIPTMLAKFQIYIFIAKRV